MSRNKIRIGMFDSGVGGLTVLRVCQRKLPQATFYYYGDNFRAPYGGRPRDEIGAFVEEGLDALAEQGISAAVLACNTATAVCAEAVRKKYPFPILGMEPAVKPAAEKYRDLLVLATPRTAESGRLYGLAARFPFCKITLYAVPGLAGAIEAYVTRGTPFSLAEHLPALAPQCVVLGCTHYSFFRREIARFYGCEVFDGNEGTARHLLETVNLGIRDHQLPRDFASDGQPGGVIFLGKAAEVNKTAYNSNVCSIF